MLMYRLVVPHCDIIDQFVAINITYHHANYDQTTIETLSLSPSHHLNNLSIILLVLPVLSSGKQLMMVELWLCWAEVVMVVMVVVVVAGSDVY